jgi:hypothetical protein
MPLLLINSVFFAPVFVLLFGATSTRQERAIEQPRAVQVRVVGCAVEAIEEALPLVGADQYRLVQDVTVDGAEQLGLGRTNVENGGNVQGIEREDITMGT